MEESQKKKKSVFSIVITVVLSVFGVFLITIFAIRMYLNSAYIFACTVGDSMYPTFSGSAGEYEYIMFKKVKKKTVLKRFDVVAVHISQNEDWMKRIVGLPNEKIAYHEGLLYINDNVVNEPFVTMDDHFDYGFEVTDIQLGANEYFIIGDNRTPLGTASIKVSRNQIYGVNGFVYKTCNRPNKNGWGIFEKGCKITYRKINNKYA